MNRLQETYQKKLSTELFSGLSLDNVHQTPKLTKIVVSSGVGRATQDQKYLDAVVDTLTQISGQKPVTTRAKHSIATYKLREGNEIGAKVTLRGERMWDFLDRLINVVLPRLRDFRGLSYTLDGHGNYNIGLSEQTVFPEISHEHVTNTHGIQITLVTNTNNDEQALALLRGLGLPIRERKNG